MNSLAETQIRNWTVHDVHFLNQLPALLEVLKVHNQELEEQLLALQTMQRESQPQLQTIYKQHQNRLHYYRELQTIVNQWQQQAQYSYQRAHCEFIDATLKEIIELCEKIVDLADDMIKALSSKSQEKPRSSFTLAHQNSYSIKPAIELQPDNSALFSNHCARDIGFATVSNDVEDIAGWLLYSFQNSSEIQRKHNKKQTSATYESKKGFLQTWLNWGPEDCQVWIQM